VLVSHETAHLTSLRATVEKSSFRVKAIGGIVGVLLEIGVRGTNGGTNLSETGLI
jgi:hypothetical protein